MSEFVWPSDEHRAENRELDYVCDYLEDTLDKLDALRALYESTSVELRKARARVAELERDVAYLEYLDAEAAGRTVDEGPKLITAAPDLFKQLYETHCMLMFKDSGYLESDLYIKNAELLDKARGKP